MGEKPPPNSVKNNPRGAEKSAAGDTPMSRFRESAKAVMGVGRSKVLEAEAKEAAAKAKLRANRPPRPD